jgi:hypothetical protein
MCRITKNSGIILIICLILQSSALSTDFAGGKGEPNNPYQIATAGDLMLLGESPEYYDKHFILTADINLDPNLPGRKAFDKAVIAPDANGLEGFFQGTPFTGVFDGNGYTISHLTITGAGYLGLFGQLGSGAKISNLGLEMVDVNGADDYVGSLVGWNYHGSIISCYSVGTVKGDGSVGGLVGWNYHGSIISSYSTGTVDGNGSVGGLVGSNSGSITAGYSTCVVLGVSDVGGLVGSNSGNIAMSYSTGMITGTTWDIGGLVGDNYYGSITSSFWDVETSEHLNSGGGTGLTTSEMQDFNTFLDTGWDFVNENLNGTCDYWQISPGDYPQLRSHSGDNPVMPGGLGTAQQPYLIRDAGDLGAVWFEPMAHYRLGASLDLSEITWSTAVVPWFGGTFDGNGYVISNLHIQGGEYQGLFGQLGSGAIISNLGLEAIDVNGTGDYVGGLAGYNYEGNINMCFGTGTVSGSYYIGGLVGESNYGSITSSYSATIVSGNKYLGGLVGNNNTSAISS